MSLVSLCYRLDIIRAFAMPERLCFTQELRQKLLALCDLRFEAVNVCPRELVLIIREIFEHGKAHSIGYLSTGPSTDSKDVPLGQLSMLLSQRRSSLAMCRRGLSPYLHFTCLASSQSYQTCIDDAHSNLSHRNSSLSCTRSWD